ncbi:RNA polymerase sigma factor [Dinghuibacter silviterrae]|uniref:DNA-directed RNA polymerase specialized sigma24 family protein n=1 Tax=Dinghuibacter silviterrae TaxID=1539049 RepID=A0A4R8DHF1_9BACT|nr:sigma-70 family RNA polymerase sigma factor [Dinghuibacter silviterrae]TDW97143.1 DNA-directed RNA polymerase specialized sigma24 family protein [Dinghuibacter silviterrae]
MRLEEFSAVYRPFHDKLYQSFSYKLRVSSYKGNKDDCIRELIQITALETYLKCLDGRSEGYPLTVLIRLTARDVFYDFFNPPKKEPNLVALDYSSYMVNPDPDPYEQLVLREQMDIVRSTVDPISLELLERRVDKIPYQVLSVDYQSTVAAIKAKLHRKRAELRERLTRG